MGLRTPLVWINNDGAICVKLTNKSGDAMVKGEVVIASATTNLSFDDAAANDVMPIGAVQDASIANDAVGWIGFSGMVYGKADAGGFTNGQWVGTGGTAKLLDGDTTPAAVVQHGQECGHGLEAATDGQVKRLIWHNN